MTAQVTDLIDISIHGLIRLQLDRSSPWVDDLVSALGDIPRIADAQSRNISIPTVRICHDSNLSSNQLREVGYQEYIGPDFLLDTVYNTRLSVPDKRTVQLDSNSAGLEWMMWSLQLALLHGNNTLVHAAAMTTGEGAILLPSWGGVGKTAIVSQLVSSYGLRLLGDDFVIVSSGGTAFSFPKPMVIYPYHRVLFPSVFGLGHGPKAPQFLNSTLTVLARQLKPLLRISPGLLQFARRHNPQSVRINPSQVFHDDCLALKAPIKAVVWLDRVPGLSEFELQRSGESLISRIIGSTLHDFDPRCVQLTNTAFGLGMLDFSRVYPKWHQILSSGFTDVKMWILRMPEDVPLESVPMQVATVFAEAGIIGND